MGIITKEKSTDIKKQSLYKNETDRVRPMILFEDVNKIYPNGVNAIKNLSFRIDEGEFVFLMGSSGAGKSTLIKLILLEEHPTSGNIFVNSVNLSKIRTSKIQQYRRSIGVFFQDFRLLEKKTVFQNVAFAMEIMGASKSEINERVETTLSLMGLTSKKKEYPGHLSGGEQQRVALARAIVNGPDILIADEPTGNLDPENSSQIMELLMKINSYGTTVLVATHEQDMAFASGKRIVRLDHGRNMERVDSYVTRTAKQPQEDENEREDEQKADALPENIESPREEHDEQPQASPDINITTIKRREANAVMDFEQIKKAAQSYTEQNSTEENENA